MVYIILINYNGWHHTILCLESLLNLDYEEFKIIIIDNGSRDSSVDIIKMWLDNRLCAYIDKGHPLRSLIDSSMARDYKKINLIENNHNLGFAGANNKGMQIALSDDACKYVWLLNNDTIASRDSLKKMISCAENKANKKIGIIGSKLMYFDSPEVINGLGGKYIKCIGKPIQLGINEIDRGQSFKEIDYVIGASMLVRKEFIIDVGLLSEDYFLYYEELDWSIRAKQKGWQIMQCNEAIVYHKEGSTIGSNKRLKTKTVVTDYYTNRNRILITKRYFPLYLPTVLMASVINCILRAWQDGYSTIGIICKAILHGLNGKKAFYEGL
ncbi:MAG TPA: glycosyltransferase family 2 protein [Nitrospirae bacterium]|nr:glycosyltransferase family 2 protein [Nitrospirota bacterium]